MVKGKVCQAVADLNLDVEVRSHHDPKNHINAQDCDGMLRMRIDDLEVSARSDCSVRDLMLIFNKEPFTRNEMLG